MGNTDAKKTVNPQNALELKMQKVKEARGQMVFAGRMWVVTLKDGKQVEFASRALAG